MTYFHYQIENKHLDEYAVTEPVNELAAKHLDREMNNTQSFDAEIIVYNNDFPIKYALLTKDSINH